VFITGTDFGQQHGPFISLKAYRSLYKPFHKRVNDWVHEHTPWKTFIHSCGSVVAFLDDFIEAGFDILNPVQCSAAGMDPATLKQKYGDRLVFWGGGIDTQKTLPFGTPKTSGEKCGNGWPSLVKAAVSYSIAFTIFKPASLLRISLPFLRLSTSVAGCLFPCVSGLVGEYRRVSNRCLHMVVWTGSWSCKRRFATFEGLDKFSRPW